MVSEEDLKSIARQLGKRPRHVLSVVARCPAGHPCVITTHPLRRQGGKLVPFPTLFWLTCPAVSRAVANVERRGVIEEVESLLAKDEAMRLALARDHDDYAERRWALLSPEEVAMLRERGQADELRGRGIGGMGNRAAVKCLHLHVAHHLAVGNTIGRWVLERFGIRPCGTCDTDASPMHRGQGA